MILILADIFATNEKISIVHFVKNFGGFFCVKFDIVDIKNLRGFMKWKIRLQEANTCNGAKIEH